MMRKSDVAKNDENYMKRCLELARLGKGHVAPNPMVGSVIVYQDQIIGEGYHREYGKAHAEVNAINSVTDQKLLKEATLYVNLEPCAHFGKTPPCSKLIIEKEIPHVVIGCVDSFSEVSGKGITMMKEAGIEVTVGVLEEESRDLNRRFFTFHEKQRPYIILKWAQTLDGFIDFNRSTHEAGHPTWISNEISRVAVHKMRAEEDAIMIGTNTARQDNPALNVRDWAGNSPMRVILDRTLRLPDHLQIFDKSVPTMILTQEKPPKSKKIKYKQVNFSENLLSQVMLKLHKRDIQSLIVEGGSQLLQTFIDENLWDEAHVFIGPHQFGDGVKAPILEGHLSETTHLEDTLLYIYKNPYQKF